ncbi:MAG: GUN4 domain-containing protein, partial [Cyanobacteria bacterium P01_G01_bin.49]
MMRTKNPFNKLLLAFVFSWLSLSNISAQEIDQNDASLISPETDINYSRLRRRLAQKEWLKANETTTLLMLESADRSKQGWMSRQEMAQLP